ncbi:MAG: BON domain-containing protein [Pirellula sp.]
MNTKTDSQIQNDVIAELKSDPSVNHENVGVAVHNGVVTLNGIVPEYAQKLAAEQATLRVRGVKGVAEEIEVQFPNKHDKTDTDIAEAATSALEWHVWTRDNVQVKVEKGWLTLTGEVNFQFEKASAQECVRFLTGVRGVTNNITIKPHINVPDLKHSIEQALVRDAALEAKNIKVSADGGKVILSGKVHSGWERQAASKAAWRTAGVHMVCNELEVD